MSIMQQRTIVRSLTTNDGTLVAMNDGSVVWKPLDGRPTRTTLEDLPTVLLALRGPMGPVDAAAGFGRSCSLSTVRSTSS